MHCRHCADLRDECGERFDMYAKKLLVKGWAGATSPVERAYRRAHAPAGTRRNLFLAAS